MDRIRFIGDISIRLTCKLDDGTENLYPQAKVYHPILGLVATLDLRHTFDGIYLATWAGSSAVGKYTISYEVYTDIDRLVRSTDYNEGAESIYLIKSLNTMYDNVVLLRAIQAGRWKRDGTQMIFYDEDNVTIIATYDLKDNNGNPADESKNVFERVKV